MMASLYQSGSLALPLRFMVGVAFGSGESLPRGLPHKATTFPGDLTEASFFTTEGTENTEAGREGRVRTGQDPILPLRSGSVSSVISVVKRLAFLANGKGKVQIVIVDVLVPFSPRPISGLDGARQRRA